MYNFTIHDPPFAQLSVACQVNFQDLTSAIAATLIDDPLRVKSTEAPTTALYIRSESIHGPIPQNVKRAPMEPLVIHLQSMRPIL